MADQTKLVWDQEFRARVGKTIAYISSVGKTLSFLDPTSVQMISVVYVRGYPILVYRSGGEERTYLAGCPHKRRPITAPGYEVKEYRIIRCPFHGAEFDLLSGEMIKPPDSKTPCPSPCRLIRAILKDGDVEFQGEPFSPELPKPK
jgi:nitrite reductase/ring-hydroxylating ferredoxin subunit